MLRMFAVAIVLLGAASAQAQAQEQYVLVEVPPSQDPNGAIRIMVSAPLTFGDKPILLIEDHDAGLTCGTGRSETGVTGIAARHVFPNSPWRARGEPRDGTPKPSAGTELWFDVSHCGLVGPGALYARMHLVVAWCATQGSDCPRHFANAGKSVLLANVRVAWAYSALGALALVLAVAALAWRRQTGGGAALNCLLCDTDGTLSLSKSQIALWTVVIATMVAGMVLTRGEAPEIPPSLVVLMGMSLATGGIGQYGNAAAKTGAQPAVPSGGAPPPQLDQGTWTWSDLLAVRDGSGRLASLARAQMLFWTLALILVFVVKSLADKALWDIPWELVALMGFSQTGYVLPKFRG